MNIGYARVSTGDQTLHLQLDALQAAGCARVFEETASGAKADRPILQEAIPYARSGDIHVGWTPDSLGPPLAPRLPSSVLLPPPPAATPPSRSRCVSVLRASPCSPSSAVHHPSPCAVACRSCVSLRPTSRSHLPPAFTVVSAVTLLPPLAYGLLRLSVSWAIALVVFAAVVRRVAPERGADYGRMREAWA